MARVEISFFTVGNRSTEGGSMPVARAHGMRTEVLEAGAATVVSRTVAERDDREFARIEAAADVWVVAGATPKIAVPAVGEVGAGCRATAGLPLELALEKGDRIAVRAL